MPIQKVRSGGSTFDNILFLLFLVDEAREDPHATISRPSSARQ